VRSVRTLLACVAILAALPASATAGGGGGGAAAPGDPSAGAGGGSFGAPVPGQARSVGRRKRHRVTLLTFFELPRKHLYLHGRPGLIRFALSGRGTVHVRLRVLSAADRSRVATIDLGERGAGEHTATFTGLETGVLPEGAYLLRLAGRGVRRAPEREGHSHLGHDLAAAEGTPVVAPRGGLVEAVQYQAEGAGHYVVLDGDDEDHDYAFMHLRSGSITVEEGDRVRTGQRIAEVGSTGRSTGPHLHFEIWVGGWFAGGRPIDPLPLLQSWV
jgi:murein DD-endopeptidase MepM/ murein hydrolase activator NlpD